MSEQTEASTSAPTGAEDLRAPARSNATTTSSEHQHPIEASEDGTASQYLALFRLDDRFSAQAVARNEPIIEVLVNFENLCTRIYNLLLSAYISWPALRSRIEPDRTRMDNAIQAGCHQLSYAFIYLLYSFLRRKTSRFHPSKYNIYRNRCFFDEKREIPEGLAYLVEQFGVTPAVEAFGNNRFFHVWDNQNTDTFGLPGNLNPAFNEDVLHGFLQTLRSCGVHLRSVDNRAPARTVWDSLLVRDLAASGLSFYTTYSRKEYDLPRDIFLVYGLNGAVGDTLRPITRYFPRLGAVNRATRLQMLADNQSDNPFTPCPGEAKPITTAPNEEATVDDTHPSGHIQRVHETGIISRHTGMTTGAAPLPIYDFHGLAYGRGRDLNAMTIMNVGRGISTFEIDGYYRNLLRKKA